MINFNTIIEIIIIHIDEEVCIFPLLNAFFYLHTINVHGGKKKEKRERERGLKITYAHCPHCTVLTKTIVFVQFAIALFEPFKKNKRNTERK